MCGICGFTGKENDTVLKKMTASLYHRGPDEDGYYSDNRVSLGMRRLSIIDIETGSQPIHNERSNIWTVFNGEIYNFKELRRELEKAGHKFYTDHSDTEVIVHLYEEYGIDFVHKLNGMFAIALWDIGQEKLFLIRDRMGVKPLFYSVIDGKLVFASEIKAILTHPALKRQPNFEAIYHYFTFKNIPAPFTAFDGIYSLMPAEILTFRGSEISKNRWWKVKFDRGSDCDESEIHKKMQALLEDATRVRMVSDVPFGAYLSGGVDSSTIVALMTRFSNQPVNTFCLGYEDELENKGADLFFARKVSKTFKTEHYEYIMSHRELVDDIGRVIEAFDQPFSGTISTFFLSKLITKHVKVALSGDGADELFGSYLTHRTAQPIYHYSRLHNSGRLNSLTTDERALFSPCDEVFLEDLFKKSGGEEAKWRYNLCLFSDEAKSSLLSPGFKNQINNASSFEIVRQGFGALTATDPLNRILELEWNTQLPDQVLAFADFLSMAHSVEIRSPFLDYRFVEFVATIPGHMKIRNGNVKDILKQTVEGLLPEGITKRPKEGFVLPIFDWMMDTLKDYGTGVLSENRLRKHGLLDSEAVKGIINEYYSGNTRNAAKVWNLIMFQLWWEKYFG